MTTTSKRCSAVSLLAIALSAGCPGSVIAQYEQAKSDALADPGPAPEVWEPDAAFYLAPDAVEAVVEAMMEQQDTFSGEFTYRVPVLGAVVVTPDVELKRLKLASTDRCDDCLAVAATLRGDVGWRLGQSHGSAPVKVSADFDTEFTTRGDADGTWTVVVRPKRIRELQVEIDGVFAALSGSLENELGKWAEEHLLDQIQEMPVGEFGTDEVPLRAAKVSSANRGIAVSLLTRSPTPTPLPRVKPKLESGWQLDLSADSLLDLARAQAFATGPVTRDVVIEPTGLTFHPGRFALDMRLWRPVGKGWWRDYHVDGTLELKPRGIGLEPETVEEGERSKGAAVVDPLAALGEGIILKAIEDNVAMTLPSGYSTSAQGVRFDATLEGLTQSDGVVRLRGTLTVGDRTDRVLDRHGRGE